MNDLSLKAPYDPRYDPLTAATPGRGADYAPTYWVGTAGLPPDDDGPVMADLDVDVAIIGSGFTGLSCAIHLAREHGVSATVLEANGVAWGCSTRNGGQAQFAAGRLVRSEWIARWGVDVAKAMHAEMLDAFALFRGLIAEPEIDCDPQDGGHYYIAHKTAAMPRLEREAAVLRDVFGYDARILTRAEVHERVAKDQEAAGALWEADGVGIHAGKLAFGYQRLARKLGARIHTSSPVEGWTTVDGVHHLRTPGGVVRARRVAVATGGYTAPQLHKRTRHRLLPVLSNSMVTRPLTADERAACGVQTGAPLTDTRKLRHYFRLLPDGRMQIGSRSAVTGADAPKDRYLGMLRRGLERKFPALEGVPLDYSWWGWVDVSHDMMPRIVQPDPKQTICYALGYGGNGVMYSAQAGRRLAQRVVGAPIDRDLPIFQGQLPHYGPLTPFRRIGQRLAYVYYGWRDERGTDAPRD